MGLDQYAYVTAKAGDYDRYYDAGVVENGEWVSTEPKPRELAYWRKHPNLQGWMEQLWRERKLDLISEAKDGFNCVELELTWLDLDRLEQVILTGQMAELNTTGFFFGEESDQHYRAQDLEFIKQARAELFLGLKVFYNSSW
jgi:hypothetical protein